MMQRPTGAAGERGQEACRGLNPVRNSPTLGALFTSFLRLGSVSFGGPGMVPYIGRLAVDRRRWLDQEEFRVGVALCQAVPGATAMQAAAYVGLRARGFAGAVATYVGFGLPAFVLMLVLSLAYGQTANIHAVTAALAGLRAVVVALVVNAAWTFGRPSIDSARAAVIAVASAGLFLIGGNPFLIVLGAGLAGSLLLKRNAGRQADAGPQPRSSWRTLRGPLVVLATACTLLVSLALVDPRLAELCAVMMKVDVFAFGGGFASVPLMFHEVVEARRWMPASVFLDGIALGQVTPGPIVITATFVGQRVAGVAGALVATASIFLPSLLMFLVADHFFRRLQARPEVAAAARGFVLSFVGLLAFVAVNFSLVTSWNVVSIALAVIGLGALLLKVDVVWVVLVAGLLSPLLL